MDNELMAETVVPQGSAITLQMYPKADVDAYVAKLNEKIEELTGELRIARPTFKCAECGEVGPHKWVWNGKTGDDFVARRACDKCIQEKGLVLWPRVQACAEKCKAYNELESENKRLRHDLELTTKYEELASGTNGDLLETLRICEQENKELRDENARLRGDNKDLWDDKKSSDGMITELQSEKAQAEEDVAYWKAMFEELKGERRWRNVSEENPAIGERVEAYMPYASDNHVRILRLGPYDPDDGGSQWLNDDDEDDNVGYAFGAVTAWRPLPNGPEEKPL